jgi:hypothetical protein
MLFSHDVIQEMVDEFQDFENSLRWNLLLKLMSFVGITYLLPSVYFSFLGLCYEHYRGSFHLSGIIIWLLHVIASRSIYYVPIRLSVFFLHCSPFLLAYGLYMSALPFFAPPPKRIDLVLSAALDYRLARTENGRLALVPHDTRVGDEIALLKGGKCPFVVRSRKSQWVLIGDSFVYQMMEGEEWHEEACGEMEFV